MLSFWSSKDFSQF